MKKDITGALIADTVYCDNVLVAENVKFELPDVNLKMTTLQTGGDLERPVTGHTEAMTTSITSIGIDKGLSRLVRGGQKEIEFRFVLDRTDTAGTTKPIGCKAFVKGIAKGIPGVSADLGETIEAEVSIATDRYRLVVDGEELWLIDKINQKYRVDGIDYMEDINQML